MPPRFLKLKTWQLKSNVNSLLSKLGICVLQAIHQNRPCFRRIYIGQDNGLGSDNLIFKSRNLLQKAQWKP